MESNEPNLNLRIVFRHSGESILHGSDTKSNQRKYYDFRAGMYDDAIDCEYLPSYFSDIALRLTRGETWEPAAIEKLSRVAFRVDYARDARRSIGFEVSGTVRAEDYRNVVIPALERAAREGDVRFVVGMSDFKGMTPSAMWEDLKVAAEHLHAIKRIESVTDIEWVAHMLALFGWLIPSKCGFFRWRNVKSRCTGLPREMPQPPGSAAGASCGMTAAALGSRAPSSSSERNARSSSATLPRPGVAVKMSGCSMKRCMQVCEQNRYMTSAYSDWNRLSLAGTG
ncbi:MAG: STAS/SEC14 domain-containing protein [Chloroflexi bacterium]|nr:STAS/SEC14 domain-containing protein [Chloroflexota bacterium]